MRFSLFRSFARYIAIKCVSDVSARRSHFLSNLCICMRIFRPLYLFDFIFHFSLFFGLHPQFHSSSFALNAFLSFFRSSNFSLPLEYCVRCKYTRFISAIHNDQVYTHHFIHIYFWMPALAAGWITVTNMRYQFKPSRHTTSTTYRVHTHESYFLKGKNHFSLLRPSCANFNISWSLYDDSSRSLSLDSLSLSVSAGWNLCPFLCRHIIWWCYIVIRFVSVKTSIEKDSS